MCRTLVPHIMNRREPSVGAYRQGTVTLEHRMSPMCHSASLDMQRTSTPITKACDYHCRFATISEARRTVLIAANFFWLQGN